MGCRYRKVVWWEVMTKPENSVNLIQEAHMAPPPNPHPRAANPAPQLFLTTRHVGTVISRTGSSGCSIRSSIVAITAIPIPVQSWRMMISGKILPDKLQHQQLVKVRIQKRPRNRIKLPVMVMRAPGNIDNHNKTTLPQPRRMPTPRPRPTGTRHP